MAFTCFNIPGTRTGSPFASSTFLPVGRAVLRLDPAIFPNIKRNRVGPAHRLGVQVHIVSDEEFAGADHCRAGLLIEHCWTEIGFPSGLL